MQKSVSYMHIYNMKRIALICGLLGVWSQLTSGTSRVKAEVDLITNVLMRNYSKHVLPMVKFEQPVEVTIQLILRRLVEVNEKSQYIVIYTGVMLKWNNPMLRWDPKDHMDIEHVHFRPGSVWVPDIFLYNTLDDSGNMKAKIDTAIKTRSNGDTTWLAPIQLKSECRIDVKFFPFDYQVCELEFGSWTFDGRYINISPLSKQLPFSQFVQNPAWYIVEVIVWEKVVHYPGPYPTVLYKFVMKRRILYYLTNLVIPCVIISLLAFLSFCLPVESGERIALVITMLLSMTVYMMLIFDFMPPNSEVIPLVSKFYLACIIEIALCLVATFLAIKWYHNESPMPDYIHRLINGYLASMLFFKRLKCKKGKSYLGCRRGIRGHGALDENDVTSDGGVELENLPLCSKEEKSPFTSSAKWSLAVISNKVREDEIVNCRREKWKYASKVVDRFFFVFFLVIFIVTAIFILWTATESESEAYRKTLHQSL